MVVFIMLYDLRVKFIRHVIALLYRYALAIVVVQTMAKATVCGAEGPRRQADGVMEITPARSRWRS